MRASFVIAVLLLALATAAVAHAETPDVKGFDHAGHAAALNQRGKAVDCVTCHATGKEGKLLAFPDKKHRPCANSGCHAPWPIPPSKEQAEKFCLVCHRKSDVARQKTKPFYPPFDVNPEHAVPFPHARHAVPGATGKLCAACHPGHGAGGDAGQSMSGSDAHALCSGCHERGASPSMATCQGCHKLTSMLPAKPPRPAWDAFQVTHKFQHEAHARRVGSEEGKRCSACHESLASAKDGQAIPRPKMETCGKCHDGKSRGPEGRAIFAVTGATCNRCHALPPGSDLGAPPAPPAVLPKFSHKQHMQRGTDTATCANCHQLDAKWLAQAPGKGKDHAPCADAGCHRPEFFSRNPTICAGCHLDFRAFAPARFQGLKKDSEFGREFSHLAHVKGLGDGGQNAFCQRCHQGRFEVQPTAQSHGTCAPCHGADATPRMTECAACHGLGKANGALATRDASYPWYVRSQFKHSSHENDPRANKPTPCLLCHDQVVQAQTLAAIGRPKMQQCDACHDGKISFKTTGFGCSRCHGTPEKEVTRPPLRAALLVGALLVCGLAVARAADDKPAPAAPPAPAGAPPKFNHAKHAGSTSKDKLDMTRCATCHRVDKDGANIAPGADGHQPCMASGCHLTDFLNEKTTLCLGCHASTDNFRKNPAVRVFKDNPKKEHFIEFSHQAHMRPRVAGSKSAEVVCQTCHWVDKATFRAVEKPGHPQCAPCHAASRNLPMSQCDGCHNDGDPAKHFDKQRKDVALKDNFSHEHVGHRFFDKDKMTQPIQCETCHYRVEKFATLRELHGAAIIDSITMKNNCSKCHDVHDTGKCTVCHTRATITSESSFNYHGL